ncbi:MAG: Ig-like domain-containing protein, partial [Candidatus Competibacteraceae bacterium]|nr:Ig-like domain-containing protein [Candidatus Competibacteraceae bacterium]
MKRITLLFGLLLATVLNPVRADLIFISPGSIYNFGFFNQPSSVGGVTFSNEDILRYDDTTDTWTLYFDGSDVGLGFNDINAFHLEDDGNLLLSLKNPQFISALGWVDGTDIIRFIPTSLGATTAGSFDWFFDGSDVGLNWYFEYLDAIGFSPDGRLVVSTRGWFFANSLFGLPQDLFIFNASRFGSNTAGSWELYLDGSDIGLSRSSENIAGLWFDPNNNDLYLSTKGGFSVQGGVTGTNEDLLLCQQPSFGANSACTAASVFFDGSSVGFTRPIDALHLELNEPPVANDDPAAGNEALYTTDEDTPLVVTTANGVLDNDSDPDSDPLTVTELNGNSADIGSQITLPSGALLTLNDDGSFEYDPNGQFEGLGQDEPDQDSFDYTIDDGQGGTDTATVTITIIGVNDGPTANADSLSVAEGGTQTNLDSTASSVRTNDTDLDNTLGELNVTTTPLTTPAHGSLTLNADGTFSYDHDGSETTSDSFEYEICDPEPLCDSATVTITITPVNDPPDAFDDAASVDEGGTVSTLTTPAAATSVLANDSDPEANALTLTTTPVSGPSHGTLTLNATGNGTFSYTHNGSETTSDSFVYQVCDDGSPVECATATVNITINPVNDPPDAVDDAFGTDEDTVLNGASNVT